MLFRSPDHVEGVSLVEIYVDENSNYYVLSDLRL